MSDARQQDGTGDRALDDALVKQVLAAVEEPALICDRDGTVRVWNRVLVEETPLDEGGLTGATLGDLVEFEDGSPLDRTVREGERSTGRGAVTATASTGADTDTRPSGDGDGDAVPDGGCTVTCRPLGRGEEVIGAVVTLTEADGWGVDRSIHEAAVNAIPDHVYAVDTDYRFRMMTDSFEERTGLPTEAVVGEPLSVVVDLGFVDEDAFARGRAAFERVLAGESDRETFVVRVDLGEERVIAENRLAPVERDGTIVGAVVVMREITDRVEAERALAESRERLRAVFEHFPVAMLILGADGTIEHHQGIDLGALECDPEQLHGLDVEEFEPWYPDVAAGCRRALDGETVERTVAVGDRTYRAFFEPLVEDGEVTGVLGVAADITERIERERTIEESREKLRAVVDSSPDPILMKDTEGRFRLVNEALAEFAGLSREEFIGKTPAELFGPEVGEKVRERSQRVVESGEPETVEETYEPINEDRVFLTTRAPFYGSDGDIRGTVSISRDITERRRKHDQLETLTRIQQLIHESVGALAAATSETEIKRTVCERLAESPFYELAWIGARDPSSRQVLPDCWAGTGGDALDDVTATVNPDDSGCGPVGGAYRSGEVVTVSDVEDDPCFEPWHGDVIDGGFGSAAVVPLTHGSTTHGVLVVYADRPAAFSERERAGFEAIGETVGFALSATQNRRLLESETVLRLEFLTDPEESSLREASVEHGCRLVFDGVAGTGDGKSLCYLTVEGIDPDTVVPAVENIDRIEGLSRLDGEDGPHFELRVSQSTFQLLADAGARGTRIVIENGHSRIVAEAPTDIDVRRVRDALDSRYRDVDLVARREVEPADTRWIPAGETIDTRLTDRQWSVLRAAYYSGYYAWPRETDAETLADSLDVSTPTVLQHLRKGHRRVMSVLFDS